MKLGGASRAPLLLTLVFFSLQVSAGEDLYWEGEDDGSNEYLEVNERSGFIDGHLHRFKRQLDWLFGPSSTSSTTEAVATERNAGEDLRPVDDELSEDNELGSGAREIEKTAEPKEKTLRVTFVVIQPYQDAYSDRDSVQFNNFSRTLSDAVNRLYETLPGTQRASLVRIQSRVTDYFSCKVTLDIVTTGFDNTEYIAEVLREHIRNTRSLGSIAVNETDFSATLVDPGGISSCAAGEYQCEDGQCLSSDVKCNGIRDCSDGSDELNCTYVDRTSPRSEYGLVNELEPPTTLSPQEPTWLALGPNRDEIGEGDDFTTPSQTQECSENDMQCDARTRCVPLIYRCDGHADCHDGTDERDCGESCAADDFRCNNGRCIDKSKRCDRVVDCPHEEDEKNCQCTPDEFRCANDGSCIELRRRCDGFNNCVDHSDEDGCVSRKVDWSGHHVCNEAGKFRCRNGTCISVLLRCDGFRDCAMDGSDEIGCPCSSDQWQCDHGSCIRRSKRCDGRVDCPTDKSDERNCLATEYFKCQTGKLIPKSGRCDRIYDCPPGDYSDEKNCPCGHDDFKCDNNFCIPASRKCDRTHDCQDGSDERDCTYGTVCMASQYKCKNGQCVAGESMCNGTLECDDGSDEKNCPCKREQFQCRDGSCINLAFRCDRIAHCRPHGEDEENCENTRCRDGETTCSNGECAISCDGRVECPNGEDELNCITDDQKHCDVECDGRCLAEFYICDGHPDCSDGQDEVGCANCDGPNDFKCGTGECLPATHKCNGVPECRDRSDESNCNTTVTAVYVDECNDQFRCNNGQCINNLFRCDGNEDCIDKSDEENCARYVARPSRSPPPEPCHESQFTCYDGRCIPHSRRCDNYYDCSDFSDEQNCYNSAPVSTSCGRGDWQCQSGDCIPEEERCNNVPHCSDGSDEWNCPSTPSPWATTPSPWATTRSPWATTPSPWATTPRDWLTSTHVPYPNYPDYNTPPWPYLPTPDRVPDTTPAPAYNPYPRENGEQGGWLKLKTYPEEQSVRYEGDVVFVCRDEGPIRAAVSWRRDGRNPIKPGYVELNGRLEINKVTLADSGVYICQADNYLDRPGSRTTVELIVENRQPSLSPEPGTAQCSGYEATCGNGQCIPRSSICDKKRDCSDGSDEDNCSYNGFCEPNEFQCKNGKCILKSWRCDSDDDCGDGSDEEGCGPPPPGAACRREEFQCRDRQCVPRSFHCDNRADCLDGSDEIGCAPAYVSKPATPSNVVLNPGDTLTLECQAVGVPTPIISWRLNWGHVPEKCIATSIDGYGVLTCPNMQTEDSGAYSCEAIAASVSSIGVPDAIVFVNREDICPSGYFNSEARSQSECIPCFCFGESKSCKSADLFTYSIPTPLGQGDTRLVGVAAGRGGAPELAAAAPADYHYQSLMDGATVTKIYTYERYPSTVHPYLRLPEDYNKNQLTSYGGQISYRVETHSPRSGVTDDLPTIIIKGKHRTLVYRGNNESVVSVRLTPENWQRVTTNGLDSASREDIMMTLDHIEAILLRADHNNAGVKITDFSMESARLIDSGLGAANLVEECTCPPGYEGLSCQKCASGYVRGSGPWLGSCVREEPACPGGQYRAPGADASCRPCPCPMTNGPNQFASSCSLNSRGDIVCNCFPGYGGLRCDVCEQNYVGNPLLPGDSCRYQPPTQCNREGTLLTLPPDDCQCKDQVQGRYCDQCKPGSFFLSQDFRHGCALCFCSGVSQECSSSNLRRKTTTVQFNTPQIVGQVRLFGSTASGKYKAPEENRQEPVLYRGDATMQNFVPAISTIYYWSLPANFAGDKVTSYGGFLRYQLGMWGTRDINNNAADVQLISENRLTFLYFGNFAPSSDGTLNATVQFLEKGWQRTDGKEVPREQFLLALADVKRILIKASFSAETLATLNSASIDTAEGGGGGPPALHVEQCVCPEGYEGTSCEDCAPGYTRSSRGLYLEHCKPCKCNDHSDMCHPETGECYNCRDNTVGENCELCAPGYEKDAYGRCVFTGGSQPTPDPGENTDCRSRCNSAGSVGNCDASGECICKQNVEGRYCDSCRAGTFGPSINYEVGCLPCYCSGVTDTCAQAGQYYRTQLPAPVIGDDYGGYVITDLNAEDVLDERFVPAPDQSDLTYNFNFPPTKELFWSLPQLTGNRVTSYGGSLSFKQRFDSSYDAVSTPGTDVILVGESNSVYWINPNPMRSRTQVPYRVPLTETNWFILNSRTPASRREYMDVLKDIKRILVRATLAPYLLSTSIADVEMDIATERRDINAQIAEGVEVCRCPNGYSGTSCESCEHGYYKDQYGRCAQCNCNGNDCQLGPHDEVICHCPSSATGHDCSIVGLAMELHPTVEDGDPSSLYRNITLTCKYRAPEPLTIQFYFEGHAVFPPKYFNESLRRNDGWHGAHTWHTVWDTRSRGDIYECHTLTERGSTLGVLTANVPGPVNDTSTRQPPPDSTITVKITYPVLRIHEVGTSVNFSCQVKSRMSYQPTISWSKIDGYMPIGRTIDNGKGFLFITNLQPEDSGIYLCEGHDGFSTDQAKVSLVVDGSPMTMPSVNIEPPVNDYYEGDRIELRCVTSGNPSPTISWQRADGVAPSLSVEFHDELMIIPNAREQDSGEYRCVASNNYGHTDRTVKVSVRSRYPQPGLKVNPSSVSVDEGQNTRVVCTGSPNEPPGSIEWVRQDGTRFNPNVRSNNGVLYIENAVLENQGVYVCQSPRADPVPVTVWVQSLGPPSEPSAVALSTASLVIPTGGIGSVDCIPSGYPQPLVTWSKLEGNFGPGFSQRDNMLIINNAQKSDEGYYQCEGKVQNQLVAVQYFTLYIESREAPRVEIWPKGEQAVNLGSSYQLNCQVSGIPTPVVTWSRNGGRQLSPHASIQTGNVLRFTEIEVNDEGEYTCTATNVAGSESATTVLKVRAPPEVSVSPDPYNTVQRGASIDIECRATGIPEPYVSIRRLDGAEVVPGASRVAVLRLRAASERDQGQYLCVASSPAGTVEEPFDIQIRYEDDIGEGSGDPDFEPAQYIIYENQIQTIECNATGGRSVNWRKSDGSQFDYNIISRDSSLIFINATSAQSGDYECVASDPSGVAERAALVRVTVEASPITLVPKSQTVRPGESPTVRCQVQGEDVLSITWEPLGKPFSSRIRTVGPNLIFNNIEVEDAGQYKCFAMTRFGNVSASAEVLVSGANEPPLVDPHKNEQYAHVGAAVELQCRARAAVRVGWSKDGGALPPGARRAPDGSLLIRRVQTYHDGQYVCHIRDGSGRTNTNYINLHVLGIDKECEDQFMCVDRSRCIDYSLVCDNFTDCDDNSDEDCKPTGSLRKRYLFNNGPYDAPPNLVTLDQPVGSYVVGQDVEVPCRPTSPEVNAEWVRIGDNQHKVFVESVKYREVSMLKIKGVEESDAGVYRCTGYSPYSGESSYVDYNLEVRPASVGRPYPNDDTVYTAMVGEEIDLPCIHNLEQPVQYEWLREFTPLAVNEANLHLGPASERDAGRYVCVVHNAQGAKAEARAVLRVLGVVPQFNGDSWLSLPTIRDAYHKFDIEISFNPKNLNGLVLYNSESNTAWGKYLSLSLVDGVPQLQLNTRGDEALVVNGTGPLTLNEWHTVRIARNHKDLSMYVDNQPAAVLSGRVPEGVLELREPLYLGGVPQAAVRLPPRLDTTNGFIGCISVLKLGRDQKHIMSERLDAFNVNICDTCSPSPCQNQGVCQEAETERGFVCLCPEGLAGAACERAGASCRPGLCGGGRCTDTADDYNCTCPVSYTGRNCESRQSIEYPAFTGSAYLAISAPAAGRSLAMSLQLKAAPPLADGIVMYSAASAHGVGGFISLAVRNSRLEFTYKSDEGSAPVVLTANNTLPVNDWTEVVISRMGGMVFMKIDRRYEYFGILSNPRKELVLDTPMYVGGVDEAAAVNPEVKVTGGFNGCIRDVKVSGDVVDIVNNAIDSANVQECSNNDRGDIPEYQTVCTQCKNGGYCSNADQPACTCPPDYSGATCERGPGGGGGGGGGGGAGAGAGGRGAGRAEAGCAGNPCQNGGRCRPNPDGPASYSCECRLPYAGTNCQIALEMRYSVGFNGDGYVELPSTLLRYNKLDNNSVIIAVAFHTRSDGVLLYQHELFAAAASGDFILLRVNNGRLLFEWDFGLGSNQLSIEDMIVSDGRRHTVIVTLHPSRSVTMTIDNDKTKTQENSDMRTLMHADSNVFIGGIPEPLNANRYPGLAGCVEQMELMNNGAINFGTTASGGRNAQRCKEPAIY